MEHWNGFDDPTRQFFKLPNNFMDALARIDSLAELKVILYVLRHTWGFREYEEMKKITTDEFVNGRRLRDRSRMDNGTGLSETSVKQGIAKAVEHGFLECEIDFSDKARIKKYYRLKMKPDTEQEESNTATTNERPAKPAKKSIVNYADYLQSPEWAKRRQKALRFAGFKCQVCNSNEGLNVHHRTYERLGHEHMGDMTVLCKNCHEIFHNNGELEG